MDDSHDTTIQAWQSGIDRELDWWRSYLAGDGLDWPEEFQFRFDPNAPLQPDIASLLLPKGESPRILDCAAGPATMLGKIHNGRRIELTAIDALANRYAEILSELGLVPPIPSIQGDVEHLERLVSADTFDLAYMRFALDHCYDPRAALRQMVQAVRPGGSVLIEHYRDESQVAFEGLRQWRLIPEADDLVVENAQATFRVSEAVPEAIVSIEATPTWLKLILRKPF